MLGIHITFDVLLNHILYYRVYVFTYILEQEWEAIFDSQLKLFEEVWIIECGNLQNTSSSLVVAIK